MRGRLLWFLLLLIGIGLLVLVLRHDSGTVAGFETGDFASLIYKIALLIFIGGAVLAMFRDRVAEAFQAAMLWVVIGLLLAVGYTYRHDLREVGERVLAELMPGRAVSRGTTVEIVRGQRGEFQVVVEINGARIATVYDTGASAVVLTQEAAKAAGLPLDFLNYSITGRDRERAHARRPGDARSHGDRRDRGALRLGADRAAGAIAHQPARHELPQPAAKLRGARRPAGAARVQVMLAELSLGNGRFCARRNYWITTTIGTFVRYLP